MKMDAAQLISHIEGIKPCTTKRNALYLVSLMQEIIMSKVKFKFFKITQQEVIERIKSAHKSIGDFNEALLELKDEFGASHVQFFNRSHSLACFQFHGNSCVDKKVWKKGNGGWLPKVKTEHKRKVDSLPKVIDPNSIIQVYGLGNEMVLGEAESRGIPMHSSQLIGNIDKERLYIKVPFNGDFSLNLDQSLIEVKEWEVMRDLDQSE